jgi:hypothetical protein
MKEMRKLYQKRVTAKLADGIQFSEARHCDPAARYLRPATRVQPPEARDQQPATRDQRPETRDKKRASRNLMFLYLTLFASIFIFLIPVLNAAMTGEAREAFRETIHTLSALGDRSTGTAGSQAAADYIKTRFEQLGYETVGIHKFSVPVIQDEESVLSIPARNISIPIRSIRGNAVTPQTIPSPGIRAPLVYVSNGDLSNLNGKLIEGAIILMELESGKNWLNAADLGARALIYVDRGNSSRIQFEEKFELSPLQFPRFWMPFDQLLAMFPGFEDRPDGLVAQEIQLESKIRWKNVISKNVYAIVPGSDPELQEQSVLVEAFYDSTVWVTGLSPGADEALSIATLLNLARYLRDNPPQRTVIMVATSGHAQTLAGMRDMMWSMTTRSKIQRQMKRELKALIKKSRKVGPCQASP